MQNAIGKKLTLDEVKALPDGTKVWVDSRFPEQNYFLGIKQGSVITDFEGKTRWALAADFRELCTAYEWKEKSGMNNLERLLSNIKIFQLAGVLEEEFSVFISEDPDIDSISELNDLMESEMSYWEP